VRRILATLGAMTVAALAAALAAASGAFAADPGRWDNTGVSPIPTVYYQGVTSDPARNFYFDGIYSGLYRTDSTLRQTAALPEPPGVIPATVRAKESYNHIGDISWDPAEGGRILLPLECYYPGGPNNANTCLNGAIGVADPGTLAWKYYVKLNPAQIKKAMFVEVSPDGKYLWTSDGDDLVAYNASDVAPANAANPASPTNPTISEVKRLKGAVPPSGITGAVFYEGRLFTAGQNGGPFRVYSTDLDNPGDQRLEIELAPGTVGESEGLAVNPTCGGILHWIVTPFNTEAKPPTYGASQNALLGFVPAGSQPPGSACRATQPGAVTGPGAAPPAAASQPPPATPGRSVSLRLGATRGMRRARRGHPFRIRARAVGSRLRGARISVYSAGGRRVGGSRVFSMSPGKLLRPRVWVKRRLRRGAYTVVGSARMPDGRRVRGYRRGIEINRR